MSENTSDSPRTDAAIIKGCGLMVRPEFARKLERELAAERAGRELAEQELTQCRETRLVTAQSALDNASRTENALLTELKVLRAEVAAHRDGKFDDSWALQCEENWRLENEHAALTAEADRLREWFQNSYNVERCEFSPKDWKTLRDNALAERDALKLKLEAAKVALLFVQKDIGTFDEVEEALAQLNA